MKDIQKSDTCGDRNKLIPVTVRLPEQAVFQLRRLSEEFGVSLAEVVRVAIEQELENYFGNIRYIDREQALEIKKEIAELTAICRDILNNVRRIGINYNRELRLKNAQKKYHDILNDYKASEDKRYKAFDEFKKEESEIKKTCLNIDVLNNILGQFEAAMNKAEELSWLIHG